MNLTNSALLAPRDITFLAIHNIDNKEIGLTEAGRGQANIKWNLRP